MMTTTRIVMQLCLLTTLTIGLASGLNAAPYNLADLIANDTVLTVGDKKFADWDFGDSPAGSIDPELIGVEVTEINPLLYNLQFTGPISAQDGETIDLQIFYSVATTTGDPLINGIGQSFNLSSGGTGGTIVIGETVREGSFIGNKVAQSSVSFVFGTDDGNDPPGEVFQGDDLIIDPALAKVWVTKDIELRANEGGSIGATIIDQQISQIPEPASLLLLGSGLFALALLNRMRMRGK